jgi:hypothetical protein
MNKYGHLPHFVDECDADLEADMRYYTWKHKDRFVHYRVRNEHFYVDGIRKGRMVFLHREIAARIVGRKLIRSVKVDHADGDGLNNRRGNIRIGTNALNMQNRIRNQSNNTSGVIGVSYDHRRRKWYAQATVDGRHHFMGYFENKDDASSASIQWRIDNMPGFISAPKGF